jgi:hypothetical protein
VEEEAALFRSQAEAKSFFVNRIVGQASAEGQPLSDNERWMLRFSESDPEFILDLHRVAQLDAEISDSDYEDKIVGLLERSYQRDASAGTDAQALYREASATLHQGDHYLLIMIDRALGYVPKKAGSKWVRSLTGVISFVVLVVPGSIAILISVGMAAMLLTGRGQSSGDMSRGGSRRWSLEVSDTT